MRRAHFEVEGLHFDGATKAIVTVETGANGAAAIVRVRPHRGRREVVMSLADLAQIALERDAKVRAAMNQGVQKVRRGKL